MPEVLPIPTVRYATPEGERDISNKIAPPYDVLDAGPKQQLLDRDPHNVVAIDLPVTPPKTVGPDAAYAGAAQTLQQWIADGVLVREDKPAVVAYEQRYTHDGQTHARRGLLLGVKLEEFNQPGGVFRHEMTIKGGVSDRTKLTEATAMQLSPVFGIYPDPEATVAGLLDGAGAYAGEPDLTGTTGDGVEHRVWWLRNPELIGSLQEAMRGINAYIADGHHRYTMALDYHKAHPDQAEAGSCLFFLVAAEDPGLAVLPTHRVVTGLSHDRFDTVQRVLAAHDDIAFGEPNELHHPMGLYDPAEEATVWFGTAEADPLAKLLPGKPEAWRTLDVAVLHELVLDRILLPALGGEDTKVHYTADADHMRKLADDHTGAIGIVMQATPLQGVMDVASADEVMPPKSTYFYPKLATGLVLHPLDGTDA
jgi:uncharacterized protein (DUF1015 family)